MLSDTTPAVVQKCYRILVVMHAHPVCSASPCVGLLSVCNLVYNAFPSGWRLRRLPHMPHHSGVIVANFWHLLKICIPWFPSGSSDEKLQISLVNAGQWHNVLHHLSFSERTRKIEGRHLPAMQGTMQSHNTVMPETWFGYERLTGARVSVMLWEILSSC